MQVIGQDSGSGGGPDLAGALKQAQRGFRRDVAALLEALEQQDLLIPLAEPMAGASTGERTKIKGELRLQPHFLPTPEGPHFAALFTSAALLSAIGERLGWSTGGGELEFCSIPGGVALEMASGTLDDNVQGVVLDAGADSELVLTADEVRRLVSGQAIPLVGYVAAIPDDHERTLVAEDAAPPSPELTAALERCLAELPELLRYELSRTYNPERDLEPHPTLKLFTQRASVDHQHLAKHVFAAVSPHLPAPGYVDIVFELK
ncbi:MAG TPA: SseB family protein [Polyangiaceae bacterium]